MRWSLCCIVFLVGCQSDSGKSAQQQPASTSPRDAATGPSDAATGSHAAIDAGAPEVEEDEPSKVDWILDQFCRPSATTDACDRCKAEKCCVTEREARTGESKAYAQCVSPCVAENEKPVADCWIDCDKAHPEGTGVFAASVGCHQVVCGGADACGDSTATATAADCDTCLERECTKEYLTILGTREGFLWFQCNGGCIDADGRCYQRCMDDYPELEEDLRRMAKCQASRCSACPTMF